MLDLTVFTADISANSEVVEGAVIYNSPSWRLWDGNDEEG